MVRALEKYLRPGVRSTPFCPGCGHGILMGLILRAIDESKMDMKKMLFVSGIGCAAWIPSPHFNGDTLHTLHGRALAFATGAKLYNPDLCVMVISGDGDLEEGNPYRPFDLCSLVKAAGATYVARFSVTQPMALVNSIKKSLCHSGFSFIEVLSPCPTQFGRRNRPDRPDEMIKNLIQRCILEEEAKGLTQEEMSERIITGEF